MRHIPPNLKNRELEYLPSSESLLEPTGPTESTSSVKSLSNDDLSFPFEDFNWG